MELLCGLWFKHRVRRYTRRWYVEAGNPRLHVADSMTEERLACRCSREDSGWSDMDDRLGINSLSLSSRKWDILRMSGKVSA